MDTYRQEDVLKHAREAFAETIALKVRQLRRYIPKKKDETNTDLTGAYIEEVVRGFIRTWIGGQQLIHGTLYSKADAESSDRALQIDGIVHDPKSGPSVICEGDFGIIHPVFCAGVIEIKMTVSDLSAFQKRLHTIRERYMRHTTSNHVMGVVIADSDPKKVSSIEVGGKTIQLYDYKRVGWCPVFVLFKEADGEYEPHFEAIGSLMRATRILQTTANYL